MASARSVPANSARFFVCALPVVVLLILVVLLTARCADRDPEAIQYASDHAASIVATTRPLWVKYLARPVEIPESEYTEHLRALKPDLINVGRAGVWLYIRTNYPHVTGVFIRYDPSFPTPTSAPPDSDDMTFRRLGDDVFWLSKPR